MRTALIRKHLTEAFRSINFAVSQLIIKYLYSAVNPVVAEEIYMMPELRYWYQRILIHQFNNFHTDKI